MEVLTFPIHRKHFLNKSLKSDGFLLQFCFQKLLISLPNTFTFIIMPNTRNFFKILQQIWVHVITKNVSFFSFSRAVKYYFINDHNTWMTEYSFKNVIMLMWWNKWSILTPISTVYFIIFSHIFPPVRCSWRHLIQLYSIIKNLGRIIRVFSSYTDLYGVIIDFVDFIS